MLHGPEPAAAVLDGWLDRIQRPAPAAAGGHAVPALEPEALAEVDWQTAHSSPHSIPWPPITISPTGPSHLPWSHLQRPSPAHAARVIPE
jgi:hypothetical protein